MADLTERWYDAEDLQPIQTDPQSPEEGKITIKRETLCPSITHHKYTFVFMMCERLRFMVC